MASRNALGETETEAMPFQQPEHSTNHQNTAGTMVSRALYHLGTIIPRAHQTVIPTARIPAHHTAPAF